MGSRIESFSRAHAAKLLDIFEQAAARGEIVECQMIGSADWIHPATEERLDRANAIEAALRGMLSARAGRRATVPTPRGGGRGFG